MLSNGGVQRAAQDARGAAGARQVHPLHHRDAQGPRDHPVPLPAVRLPSRIPTAQSSPSTSPPSCKTPRGCEADAAGPAHAVARLGAGFDARWRSASSTASSPRPPRANPLTLDSCSSDLRRTRRPASSSPRTHRRHRRRRTARRPYEAGAMLLDNAQAVEPAHDHAASRPSRRTSVISWSSPSCGTDTELVDLAGPPSAKQAVAAGAHASIRRRPHAPRWPLSEAGCSGQIGRERPRRAPSYDAAIVRLCHGRQGRRYRRAARGNAARQSGWLPGHASRR